MEGLSRKMSLETRNTDAARPDATLRWAGRLLFLTAIVLITDLALQPGYATPPRLFGSDKLEHLLAFMTLAMLARMGWPRQPVWALGIVLLGYGLGLEVVQSMDWVGRTASMADVAADAIGVLIGFGLTTLFLRFLR